MSSLQTPTATPNSDATNPNLNPFTTTTALPRLAYTMRETASILGVDYQTVYRLCKRGLLRSSGGLRTKLFATTEIQRFLSATLGGAR